MLFSQSLYYECDTQYIWVVAITPQSAVNSVLDRPGGHKQTLQLKQCILQRF